MLSWAVSSSLRQVEFTYEVTWTPTDIAYENRFDRYLEDECVRVVLYLWRAPLRVVFACESDLTGARAVLQVL